MIRTRIFICTALVAVCICFTNVQADMYDLTYAGAEKTINGALFIEAGAASTGSGTIQSFVRIQGKGNVQGYNTDYRPLEFDENNSATFTHSLSLSDVPIVNVKGTDYREFLLDINQKNSDPLLSLDKVEIYQGTTGDLHDYPAGLGTLVYDLSVGGEGANWILLDYSLNSGSGSGDMYAYIPDDLFVGQGDYVYLYSMFGYEHPTNSGFQEWAVQTIASTPTGSVVPVPAAVLLGMLGLGVMGLKLRKFA